MNEIVKNLSKFVEYSAKLEGYEKGEAQLFCEKLFQAFGHPGLTQIGAQLEYRLKGRRGRRTKFVDLLWQPRVLIEMKSRGEKLERHYRQAFDYWIDLVPDRPSYVILCNFDEFWIYDFNFQLDSPVDRIKLTELPDRYTALAFLFPISQKPLFNNDKVAVTRDAADKIASTFNSLIDRGIERSIAQRYILQCVVSFFAEDYDLLPRDFFSYLLADCSAGESAYDLVGNLFRQMSLPEKAAGGKYADIRYFNGGLFDVVNPIELTPDEIELLRQAGQENWKSVSPPIFGTIFQGSMDKNRRHALGAHFTQEVDIQKIVLPSIVRPWQEKIDSATRLYELQEISAQIQNLRVLDPACGSGNFLYVAYREIVNLHLEVLHKIVDEFGEEAMSFANTQALKLPSTKNFYGIDIDSFATEIAKVTLMLAKRISLADNREHPFSQQRDLGLEFEKPLPLDNLDNTIINDDALFCDWPTVDVIIGNPPFISKNKIVPELGRKYVDSVREKYPDVPGRADYCVYWFRKTHDELNQDQRAGLVGTNTIRQNYSRIGGLDYIVDNAGTITEAVSTQSWSGDASVNVSIVNWTKGKIKKKKMLYRQNGDRPDSPWDAFELPTINSALSPGADVTKAKVLHSSKDSNTCKQGQTHGHAGFLIDIETATEMSKDADAKNYIFPYLIGDDILGPGEPTRWVLDLNQCDDITEAQKAGAAFDTVRDRVMADVVSKADVERESTGKDVGPRQTHAKRWWRFWRSRSALIHTILKQDRYIACSRVTKRPVFVFVSSDVRPNDALQVFTLDDDYSFGILQSEIHWEWFTERCSTLTERFRYTNTTVYDCFPWPQNPKLSDVKAVAKAARDLRSCRNKLCEFTSLRNLYKSMELPGSHKLKDAHAKLNSAVAKAYGMKKRDNATQFIFNLNCNVASQEQNGADVEYPGLPRCVKKPKEFVSRDQFIECPKL